MDWDAVQIPIGTKDYVLTPNNLDTGRCAKISEKTFFLLKRF